MECAHIPETDTQSRRDRRNAGSAQTPPRPRGAGAHRAAPGDTAPPPLPPGAGHRPLRWAKPDPSGRGFSAAEPGRADALHPRINPGWRWRVRRGSGSRAGPRRREGPWGTAPRQERSSSTATATAPAAAPARGSGPSALERRTPVKGDPGASRPGEPGPHRAPQAAAARAGAAHPAASPGQRVRAPPAGHGRCPLPAGQTREGPRLLPRRPPAAGALLSPERPRSSLQPPPAAPARRGPLTAPLAGRPARGPHHGRGCRSRSCSSRSGSHPLRRSTRRCSGSRRPPPSPR